MLVIIEKRYFASQHTHQQPYQQDSPPINRRIAKVQYQQKSMRRQQRNYLVKTIFLAKTNCPCYCGMQADKSGVLVFKNDHANIACARHVKFLDFAFEHVLDAILDIEPLVVI